MSDTPSAPLADGTDQPVVGSGIDQEAHWHARYVEMKREFAEIDMQLAAHRYALSLQNRAVGLPEDNEAYNKIAELLIEARTCLREAIYAISLAPYPSHTAEDVARWKAAAGIHTANVGGQRPPASGGTSEPPCSASCGGGE